MMTSGAGAEPSEEQAVALLGTRRPGGRDPTCGPRSCRAASASGSAIARALCNQPGILIADEPTGSLDRGNSLAIMEMLRELHRDTGTTLLVVTHDPSVADYCDRLVEIIDGRIVRDGPQERDRGPPRQRVDRGGPQ